MLKFPRNALPSSLEQFMAGAAPQRDACLNMPIDLEYGGALGGSALAMQAIATWSNTCSSRVIVLPPEFHRNEHTKDKFASTLHGMAALYFCDSILSDDTRISRRDALFRVSPRVKAMDAGDLKNTMRGAGVALVCFAGASKEFVSPLYERRCPGGVRSAEGFESLFERILESVGVRPESTIRLKGAGMLAGLVHQLVLNADEHGSLDVDGSRSRLGIRGVTVKLTRIANESDAVRRAGEDDKLKFYIMKQPLIRKSSAVVSSDDVEKGLRHRGLQLLEISVFDSGPGLALRWLSSKSGLDSYDRVSVDQEFEAVHKCFEKHATTKIGHYYGQGLSMALEYMKQLRAFLSVRTGRLSLCQDLSIPSQSSFSLVNRFKGDRQLAAVAGTAYSICMPVD